MRVAIGQLWQETNTFNTCPTRRADFEAFGVLRGGGPGVPVVVTLDLHANVTHRMTENADAVVLYHTAPHIDVFETGLRGACVLRRLLVEGARPVTAFQKVPAVLPAERANTQDP